MSDTVKHPLRAARDRLNLTQKRLAEEIGVGTQTILRAEHNKPINAETRRLLCQYFGMTTEELGLLVEENKENDPQQASEQASELVPVLSQAIAHAIVLAAREMEGTNMDKTRRNFLHKLGMTSSVALISPSQDLLHPPLWQRLSRALTKPSLIDEDTLQHLEAMTQECWRLLPDAVGVFSYNLFMYVQERLQIVTELLEGPLLTPTHNRLATIAGELAQIMGEILFDLKNNEEAEKYYDVAIEAAKSAENDVLRAVALGRKSFIPIYNANAAGAIPLLDEARTLLKSRGHDTTRAWLAAVEAEAQANAGNDYDCLQALEQSAHFVERTQPSNEKSYTRFSSTVLSGYKGVCYLRLKQPQTAQAVLQQALKATGPTRIRHKSILLIDLATAQTQQEEIEEACRNAELALTITAQTKSARVFQRLLTLRSQLEPWKATNVVKQLDEEIRALKPHILSEKVHK